MLIKFCEQGKKKKKKRNEKKKEEKKKRQHLNLISDSDLTHSTVG